MRMDGSDAQPGLEPTRETMLARHDPEHLLDTALTALHASGPECRAMLDELPAPIYTTDAEGAVTYWNRACVDFAGRVPELGRDRWCVTWQLYTTSGEPLRHEDCPMAQAIKEQRPVRDTIAIAERPDGTRVAFKPYPTPLFDQSGAFTGAVNMLIDVTDEQSGALHEQAERCRRLAQAIYDREINKVLGEMAANFDRTAEDLAPKG
jgi:PAS domain S-box-containing protein